MKEKINQFTAARNTVTGKFFNGRDFGGGIAEASRNPPPMIGYVWDNVEIVTVTEVIGKRYAGTRRRPGGRAVFYSVI